MFFNIKEEKTPIYNTDLGLEKIVFYDSDKAKEFNDMRRKLRCLGYKIIRVVLTDSGSMKLQAVLSKRKLCKCLLDKKKIPDNDRVIPRCTTDPECCEFHVGGTGICSCTNKDYCLYQGTPKHVAVIEKMVERYDDYDRQYHDTCSTYYEDTKLGRIFSNQYNHLNDECNKAKYYYRHHGR